MQLSKGNPKLFVLSGPEANQVYELSKPIIMVGRDKSNDIVINDPTVAPFHIRLIASSEGYSVEDIDSTYGVWVNMGRLWGTHGLRSGETINLSEGIQLGYWVESPSDESEEPRVKQPTIFISHSSKDLQVARAARNILEDRNHHVLLLGLLILNKRSEAEIYELLDAEIQERDWLVLIESDNAKNSKWVQYEIERAKAYRKTIYRISAPKYNLANRYAIENAIIGCLTNFSRSIRVFLSYAHQDRPIALRTYDQLREAGFEVWMDIKNLTPGRNWKEEIDEALEETLEQGAMVFLISKASLENQWTRYELQRALESGRLVLPILIEPVNNLPPDLAKRQFLDFSQGFSEEALYQRLFHSIKRELDAKRQQIMRDCL